MGQAPPRRKHATAAQLLDSAAGDSSTVVVPARVAQHPDTCSPVFLPPLGHALTTRLASCRAYHADLGGWEAHAKIFRRRGAPYPITNPHAVTFANESQVDASSCHFVHFAAKYGCRAANETREVPPSQLLRGPNGQPYTASCVAYEAIAESALVAAVERSVWEETRTR